VPVRPLIVLHRDELLRAHLRTAGRREFDMRCVDSWSDLHAAARSTQAIPVVVVDPYAGTATLPGSTSYDAGPAPALRTFLREFPYVPVVAALETRPARFRDIRTLGSWGISEIVSLDQEALGEAVSQRLRDVAGRAMKTLLATVLPPTMGFRAHEVLAAAAEAVTAGGGDARDVARTLFVSRRTLSRRCVESGLPPPRRLLAWMRVLLACELLDDPRRTVSNIAFVCGYSSDNALRLALGTFLGRTPRELRQAGALTSATRAFRGELGQYLQSA
jgi:AraC-like DNA-binding protein